MSISHTALLLEMLRNMINENRVKHLSKSISVVNVSKIKSHEEYQYRLYDGTKYHKSKIIFKSLYSLAKHIESICGNVECH